MPKASWSAGYVRASVSFGVGELSGRHRCATPRADHGSPRWQRLVDTVRARPTEMLLAGVVALLLRAPGLGLMRESFDLVKELARRQSPKGLRGAGRPFTPPAAWHRSMSWSMVTLLQR